MLERLRLRKEAIVRVTEEATPHAEPTHAGRVMRARESNNNKNNNNAPRVPPTMTSSSSSSSVVVVSREECAAVEKQVYSYFAPLGFECAPFLVC